MSRYNILNISYGLDKPTGGYYWQEFCLNDSDELSDEKDGITLTELVSAMNKKFNIPIDTEKLAMDYVIAEQPSPLQISIGKMFNRDIEFTLKVVADDLMRNHMGFYNPT